MSAPRQSTFAVAWQIELDILSGFSSCLSQRHNVFFVLLARASPISAHGLILSVGFGSQSGTHCRRLWSQSLACLDSRAIHWCKTMKRPFLFLYLFVPSARVLVCGGATVLTGLYNTLFAESLQPLESSPKGSDLDYFVSKL